MGEPMDNLDMVLTSVHILNDGQGHHLGQRHITLFTCGLPEGIGIRSQSEVREPQAGFWAGFVHVHPAGNHN